MNWRPISIAVTSTITTPITFFLLKSSSFLLKTPQKYSQNNQYTFLLTRPFSNLQKYFTSFSNVPQMFDKMPQREKSPSSNYFYNILDIVKLSSINPNNKTAKIVHCLVLKVGFFSHLPTPTSLLVTYSKAGEFGSSTKIFDDIKYKDVIAWNAMMTVCIENNNCEASINLFMEMRDKGNNFNSGSLVITVSAVSTIGKLRQGRNFHGLSVKMGMLTDLYLCNSLIDMYAKCGDLGSSVNYFELMEVKDCVSWNSIISGCLRNNSPYNSLKYFRKMANIGIHDDVSISCAVAASTCLGDLDIGESIHGCGIKLGYIESTYISVNNAIISFYAECGHPEVAEVFFNRMVSKDIITWNSMINGFVSNGMAIEAFDILYKMQLERLMQPDSVTLVTIIPLCAELELFIEGKSVHAYVIRRNMGSNSLVFNSLMDFYLKCGSVREAEYLFNATKNRDLVSWNTIISGYSQLGYYREAQILFKELIFWCSKCSLSTILSIFPSCCSPESLAFGKTIHGWKLKSGFSNNILAINALMFMYINCGDLKAAYSLLASIYDLADTASWNTLITGCSQNGYFGKALEIFGFMRKYDAKYDRITLSNVISACGKLGLVIQGKLIHGLSIKSIEGTDIRVQNALITMYGELGETESANLVFISSHNRNLCSWNCIISALSHNKETKKALEMFQSLDIKPNEITISSILSACTQLGLLSHGRQIHAYIFRLNFQTNPYISAALVDMYSNCGRLDNALQVFHKLRDKSVAAWNSVISAYGYHNNTQKTIKTFNEMIEHGINPTKSTFINLLSACSHLGLVDEGQWYYNNMLEKYGIEQEIEHQVCMVDMLGRSGRLNEAREFIKNLPNKSEPGIWGALLSGCGYYGDIDMGKEVAEILFGLEPNNSGYYVLLFNMYVGAGRWDDAAKLRRKIEEKRLKKLVGLSLIDT